LSLVAHGHDAAPVETRLLASQRALVGRGADLIARGSVAEGCAYLDLAQNQVEIKVGFDGSQLSFAEADRASRAVEKAVAGWKAALGPGARMSLVPLSQANVRVHARPSQSGASHLAGVAHWVKRVVRVGQGTYEPRVSADVTLQTRARDGKELAGDVMDYVTAHELGHVLGLDDTAHTGELMGPAQLHRPVSAPSEPELRALVRLSDQADFVARVATPRSR
jgi:hypothetical protein